MKKRKINMVIGAFFALAMTVSTATTLSLAKANNHPEVVLAEDVKDSETPISSATSDAAASMNGAIESIKEQGKEIVNKVDKTGILKVILKTLRDALRDLRDHIRRWFKLNK